MKKRIWIFLPLILVVLAFILYRVFLSEDEDAPKIVDVERDRFELYVVSMGSLEAYESTDILIPDVLLDRTVHFRDMEITDLVREGTRVEKGDYVATLDPSEIEEDIANTLEELESLRNNLESARMDSSLNLSESRDGIRQAEDLVLDSENKVEQSRYESEAVQRQAQIELERSKRRLDRSKRNYSQEKRRNEIHIKRLEDRIKEKERDLEILQQLKKDLRITAPSRGVVVYARDRHGNKVKVGSDVHRWDPRIAILPDLSTILSVAYVKEIDVSKIRKGMPVKVAVDALPGEEFDGTVKRVANIGQKIPGQFLNGFKVEVEVNPDGFNLLPGMTSINRFIIHSIDDQLMVPREAVFVDDESQIVYKKTTLGIVKQKIETGGENEEYVRVIEGVEKGDKVLLSPPD